jgi:hypothetical protein
MDLAKRTIHLAGWRSWIPGSWRCVGVKWIWPNELFTWVVGGPGFLCPGGASGNELGFLSPPGLTPRLGCMVVLEFTDGLFTVFYAENNFGLI